MLRRNTPKPDIAYTYLRDLFAWNRIEFICAILSATGRCPEIPLPRKEPRGAA